MCSAVGSEPLARRGRVGKNAHTVAVMMPDLASRRAIVTGANTGLGFQTSRALAAAGCSVTLAVRDLVRGRIAYERLRQAGVAANVEVAELDLADLRSVRRFAEGQSNRVVDILVNNAGVMLVPTRQYTADGFELQMGVNHLGHFALTALLLPSLLAAERPRVVTVSSMATRLISGLDRRLGTDGPYSSLVSYAQSKLACALFGFELDRRSKQLGIALQAVVAHPGWSATELTTRQPGPSVFDQLAALVTPVVGSTAARGAASQIMAACDPSLTGGEFVGPRRLIRGRPTLRRPRQNALDQVAATWLWHASEAATGVRFNLAAAPTR
jgi:NAD(P)-dependent dehydrogenase (short-subunit alcohol dehydrogenase family)